MERTKLHLLVRAASGPEVEEEGEKITGERSQVVNKETHRLGWNEEFEGTIAKTRDFEMGGRAANGGLKNETNRNRAKLELATAEGDHKRKRIRA